MDWSVVFDNYPVFLQGLWATVQLSAVSAVFALMGGLGIALMRISRFRVLRIIASAYINVLRSIPPFALIIYVYYGIAIAVGINFSPFAAGVLALSLQYAAWIAEVYRSGIQAVPGGQAEAAQSLGFSNTQTFFTIVLPQALRIVIPPLGNNVVGLIKDSSLVSYIGVAELIRTSQLLVSTTFRPFEVYTATIIIYLVLTIVISQLFGIVERRHATGRDALARGRHISKARSARLVQLRDLARTSG
jgi:His/Glu/Gln/Arg/opine family amino acid ABC transporter permease subunit